LVRSKPELGTITITASGTNLTGGTVNIQTVNTAVSAVMLEILPIQIYSGNTAVVTVKILDTCGNVVSATRPVVMTGNGLFSRDTVTTQLLTGTTTLLFTGTTAGDITITGTSPDLSSGTIHVTVLPSTRPVTVTVTGTEYVYAGDTNQITLTAVDACGNKIPVTNMPVTLKISNVNTGDVSVTTTVMILSGEISLYHAFVNPGVYKLETTGTNIKLSSMTITALLKKSEPANVRVVSVYGTVRVTVPSGTFTTDVIIELLTGDKIRTTNMSTTDNNQSLMNNSRVELVARDTAGVEILLDLAENKHLVLEIPYLDITNDGFVDGTQIPESTLRINRDGGNYSKEIINSAPVNSQNIVSGHITKTGIYSITGISTDPQVFNMVAYPNPFSDTVMISFELGSQASVRLDVYTVTGRLIRTLNTEFTDPVIEGTRKVCSMTFDGFDDSGKPIATGTYIYKLKTEFAGNTHVKTGKFQKQGRR
jgi:hypothetical protein